jgi:hypothetical protein
MCVPRHQWCGADDLTVAAHAIARELADERRQSVNSPPDACLCKVFDQQAVLLPCKHASFLKECAVALQHTSPRCHR